MFDFHYIELENFRSFSGKHKFVFPVKAGLYFITGDNKDEPRLERNGAGKSTLLDAINWVLYGKSLRDLKGNDVVTWGEKSCRVSIEITVADKRFLVTRIQNPNSLTLDGKIVEQDELLKTIVLSNEAFAFSVIKGQFGQSFFDKKPAAKAELFSQIMGLDFWIGCSQKAAVETEKLEKTALSLSQNIDSITGLLTVILDDIQNLGKKEGAFAAEQQLKVQQLEREADECALNIKNLKDLIKKDSEDLDDLLALRDRYIEELQSVEDKQREYRDKCNKLDSSATEIKTLLAVAEADYESLSKLKAVCPTCLQQVDKQHLITEKNTKRSEIAELTGKMLALGNQFSEAQRFIKKINKDLTVAKDKIHRIDMDCSDTRYSISNNEASIRVEKQDIKKINLQIKDEYTRPNPYKTLITERIQQKVKLEEKLKQLEKDLATENARLLAYSYWVNGFKRVRLFLIEETLTALELEVNSALTGLGLIDWQIEFAVERENKNGGLTKGFIVLIRCPKHPEPVRLEAYSGGEGQRLQQASDLGLANLIMTQAGLTNKIEFFDEPSSHLSDSGLTDLAETLQQRAIEEDKRIFIIDHRAINFGDFTDIIKVTKTSKGSEINYDN